MKNHKNDHEEELNPILSKIAKILKYTKEDVEKLKEKQKTKGVTTLINSILSDNKDNKTLVLFLMKEYKIDIFNIIDNSLKSDKQIALLAIRRNSDNFFLLNKTLQADFEIAKEVIKSQVREGKTFLAVEEFISKYFPKNLADLFSFYEKYLDVAGKIFNDDLSKTLILIRTLNPDLFTLLNNEKIIILKLDKIIINPSFIKKISDEYLENSLQKQEDLSVDDLQNLKIAKLLSIFGILPEKMDQNTKFIFETILKLVDIEIDKNDIKNKKEKEQDLSIKKNEKSKEEVLNIKDKKNNDFDELLDYCSPSCSYTCTAGGFIIETSGYSKVKISTQEKEKFTSESLKNFIKFHNTLYNLGLNFLWDKYSNDFKILCNNKFGFDYTSGEGITDSKTLSVLYLIGKNTGIPEHKVLDDEGKETKELKCFKTLGDAKMAFLEIKQTGKINGDIYSDLSMNSNGAVENKLIEVLCIDQKGNGLNISKWK